MSKVLVCPDLHFPFHDKNYLRKFFEVLKEGDFTHVVNVGDVLDQYVFSRYPKNPNITPEQEIKKGLYYYNLFWDKVKQTNPNAKCIQILGNHDVRIAKRIAEKLPELASVYDYTSLYKKEGVKVLKSDREYHEIDGVVYVHGWLSKSLDHAKHFKKPTVHGHRHRPALETEGTLWSMDVGHGADEKQAPLQYTNSTLTKWRHAYGVVENGKPKLVLL